MSLARARSIVRRALRATHLNLGSKIAFSVGGILVVSATILAIVAVRDVRKLGTYMEATYEDSFLPYQEAEHVDVALERTQFALETRVSQAPLERQVGRGAIDADRQLVATSLARYEADLTVASEERMRGVLEAYRVYDDQVTSERASLSMLIAEVPRLNALADTIWHLAEHGEGDAARAAYEQRAVPLFRRLIAATTVLMAMQLEESMYANRAAHDVAQGSDRSIALAFVLTLVLALATILWLTRHVTRPLKALVLGTHAIARGDLSQPVVVTTRDELGVLATAFNQMIASLRIERDRAQRYLDTAQVILLALDMEGRITLVNRYACSVLGWTADELLGRYWVETCLPAARRDALREAFHNLLAGDLAIVENAVCTRSGSERLFEWRNRLLRDENGQVTGTFSSGTDITERNAAIEALRATEEHMRFALFAASAGIWDMDFTIGAINWSEALEAQYGLAPGAFGGTFAAFADLVHPSDWPSVLATVMKAKKTGSDFSVENRAILTDGTVRWLRCIGHIFLDADGTAVRGVGISLDVTERHALEEQYQQAQKMEAVGQLAGGIAHDFNNLLSVILGYGQLVLDDLDPTDARRADMEEIQKAGTQAAGLTRALLAFSRKQIIEPTVLDINVVVSDMRAMLGRLIGEHVNVVLALRPRLAPVKADRGQLEQIVMNLAVNARDAMPAGGTLTIETANVVLDDDYAKTHLAVTMGPYVALTVTDTGSGIEPAVLRRLFEPFFTTKDVGKGTGLGLATVHGIALRSGGRVDVESEVGRGTSFTVYFPQCDPAELVSDAASPVSVPNAGGQTVLVVDDAEGLGELARRLLERQGYRVLVATNADDAQRIFEENPLIDLILTDVVMPGVSGPDLARRMIEQRRELKVIYMSGYTDEAIVQHGVLNAGIAFLNKPFTAETLGQKLREVLDG